MYDEVMKTEPDEKVKQHINVQLLNKNPSAEALMSDNKNVNS